MFRQVILLFRYHAFRSHTFECHSFRFPCFSNNLLFEYIAFRIPFFSNTHHFEYFYVQLDWSCRWCRSRVLYHLNCLPFLKIVYFFFQGIFTSTWKIRNKSWRRGWLFLRLGMFQCDRFLFSFYQHTQSFEQLEHGEMFLCVANRAWGLYLYNAAEIHKYVIKAINHSVFQEYLQCLSKVLERKDIFCIDSCYLSSLCFTKTFGF